MSAYFTVALDTHAPRITWGDITGADAGETLVVAYTADEPGVASAELELPGGGRIPMRVAANQLAVDIPAASLQGTGVLRAYVEDDVGNTGTVTLDIALDGAIPPAVVATGQGFPRQGSPVPRVVRSVGRAGAGSRDSVRALLASASRARATATYLTPTTRRVVFRDAATAQSTGHLTGKLTSAVQAATGSSPDVIRHREGPNAEDELIVLGLL